MLRKSKKKKKMIISKALKSRFDQKVKIHEKLGHKYFAPKTQKYSKLELVSSICFLSNSASINEIDLDIKCIQTIVNFRSI